MSNLEKLKDAGVIAEGADLSSAETTVIDGLSEEEVNTLISIRKKLGDQLAKEQEASAALSMPQVSSNFIV